MTKFERCLWIVEKLLSNNTLSFEGIKEKWEESFGKNYEELYQKKLSRDIKHIADCFGLDIEYSPAIRGYFLKNKDAIKNEALYTYLLDAFHVRELNTLAVRHKDKIMFQDTPTGVEHLKIMLNAIGAKKTVIFDYHSYYLPDKYMHFEIIPCFLRMFEGRWYLICEYLDRSKVLVLALERMKNVTVETTTRECSPQINPDDYYGECFGIIHDDEKPVVIRLKVYNKQIEYIRSQPLHPSQKEIEVTDTYVIFSYYLRPSFDFMQKILWNREMVEILSPKKVRDDIKSLIEQILAYYKDDTKRKKPVRS
jgi:predicted DNA-binding transcriptional regulator YafY